MAATRAQTNRAIRQEALREQLSEQCRVQHIFESIGKLEKLEDDLDTCQANRIKIAMDARFKLLGKYLPDLKATELTGPDGEPLPTEIVIQHVKVSDRKP